MPTDVKTWKKFAHLVRATQPNMLQELPRFRDAILITGCQRSGGTMLSRLITNSEGMHKFWFGKDEELDAGLILSGYVPHEVAGRYCFQTTYLNECWREYLAPGLDYRMVWSLRNPHSVAFSMVYNWKRFALDELFLACGYSHMDSADRVRFLRFGIFGIPPIRRAAYAFVGKVSQVLELAPALPEHRLTVLEYDELVQRKADLLPALYERLGLSYLDRYADAVSERSLGKKKALSAAETEVIDRICAPVYAAALKLVNLR